MFFLGFCFGFAFMFFLAGIILNRIREKWEKGGQDYWDKLREEQKNAD